MGEKVPRNICGETEKIGKSAKDAIQKVTHVRNLESGDIIFLNYGCGYLLNLGLCGKKMQHNSKLMSQESEKRKKTRNIVLIVVASAVALLLLAGFFWWWWGRSKASGPKSQFNFNANVGTSSIPVSTSMSRGEYLAQVQTAGMRNLRSSSAK